MSPPALPWLVHPGRLHSNTETLTKSQRFGRRRGTNWRLGPFHSKHWLFCYANQGRMIDLRSNTEVSDQTWEIRNNSLLLWLVYFGECARIVHWEKGILIRWLLKKKMYLNILFINHTTYKNYLKIMCLIVKSKSMKFLDDFIEENLCSLGLAWVFRYDTESICTMKEKNL